MKKNLILSLAKNYTYDPLEPFIRSLESTGFDGEVVFLYSEIDIETLARLREHDIKLVPFEFKKIRILHRRIAPYAVINRVMQSPLGTLLPVNRIVGGTIDTLSALRSRGPSDRAVLRNRMLSNVINLMCLRFVLYQDYLREHGSNYSNVMITDVRDVLFQTDPFAFDIGDSLCCFLEDERWRIRDDGPNHAWIQGAYGEKEARSIENNLIACAGVTIGSTRAMGDYLEAFIQEVMRIRRPQHGVDQGIHNYLVHRDRIDGIRLFRSGSGPVMTMGLSMDLPLKFDANGMVLNEDGTTPNVLHQYDRFTKFLGFGLESIAGRYRLVSPRPTEGAASKDG